MARILALALAGMVTWPLAARAADGPAGSWKLALPGTNLTMLFRLEEKDGKWSAQYLGSTIAGMPKLLVGDLVVTADSLRLALRIPNQAEFQFEGKLPPDSKTGKILGSLQMRGNQLTLVGLEPSKLKAFDKFEFNKETVEQSTDPVAVLDAATELVKTAAEKKAKVEEVRGWADKAFKPAEAYGVRWQRTVTTRLAQAAASHKEYAPVAVEYARRAERLLDPDDDTSVQMEVLEAVSQTLAKAGRVDDARQIEARLTKLEDRDFADYLRKVPFKPDPFDGRKSKSERAVLVEIFTGAECQPCVAADVAFDALDRTYKPTEVVLLQYHLPVPGPDPLTSPDTLARAQYYGRKLTGTPTVFFNGNPGAPGGGQAGAARKKYAEFREVIEPLLERDAQAKIELVATRKGSEVSFKANVSGAGKTGDNVRLRLALVEDHVRYAGGNGLRYHHCVVRAFAGGSKGFAVAKKDGEFTATINLDELRSKLGDYLDDFAKNEDEFPRPDRPMAFKKLRAVAFVQDDEGNDVLQAVQVDVK